MKQTKGSSANEATKGLDCKQQADEQKSELKPPLISNGGKNDIQEPMIVTKTIKKASLKKTYSFISDEMRLELLKAVKDKKEKIKHVAKRLGINYSSAKSICQVFQKEGRTKRVIVKKKGIREDGANGTNKLVISEDIKVMISLSGRFKANEVDLSSSTKPKTEKKVVDSINTASPSLEASLLAKSLPQLACINVSSFLKQPEDNRELFSLRFNEVRTIFNPIMMVPNGQSINVSQPQLQGIRLDSQLVSYPVQMVDPFSSGFQQSQTTNLNAQVNSFQTYNNMIRIQIPQNTNTNQDVIINRGMPVQNLPLGASIYPIQACFINNQQLNNKPAGNIIFPVIQTQNHTIGKGRFSMTM